MKLKLSIDDLLFSDVFNVQRKKLQVMGKFEGLKGLVKPYKNKDGFVSSEFCVLSFAGTVGHSNFIVFVQFQRIVG